MRKEGNNKNKQTNVKRGKPDFARSVFWLSKLFFFNRTGGKCDADENNDGRIV